MRNAVAKLFTLILAGAIVLGVTGCGGTPPKPYRQTLPTGDKMPQELKQSVVNEMVRLHAKVVASEEHIKPFRTKRGCVYAQNRGDSYKNCFVVTEQSTVIRRDLSKCHGECSYSGSRIKDYVGLLNSTQEYLQKKLPSILEKYPEFSAFYDREKKKLDRCKDRLEITILDPEHILPKSLLSAMYEQVTVNDRYPDKHDTFFMHFYHDPDELKKDILTNFNVEVCVEKGCFQPMAEIGNWMVFYDKTNGFFNASTCPESITFTVRGVIFKYLPKTFSAHDDHIKIEVINDLEDKIKSFIVYNNTKKFIKINAIAGYYNGKIDTNLLVSPITLPPMSYKNITDMMDHNFPSSVARKSVGIDISSSFDQDETVATVKEFYRSGVDYGFSVNYSGADSTRTKTLYKQKLYTIEDILHSEP